MTVTVGGGLGGGMVKVGAGVGLGLIVGDGAGTGPPQAIRPVIMRQAIREAVSRERYLVQIIKLTAPKSFMDTASSSLALDNLYYQLFYHKGYRLYIRR
ncbi:MAG: hypothetical protein HY668_01485 [Chloroflexi bacterium]|nr:hypothetical protein [Chloroflexota bacterium]